MFRSRRPQDQVHELPGAPQSSAGAPLPVVLADEHQVFVVYRVEQHDPHWDGTTARLVDVDSGGSVVIARFVGAWSTQFGAPNDEALHGHPLFNRGLRPYGAFSVQPSSWKAELAARNAVHENHSPGYFETLTHYVLTFHDSTFECLASSVEFEVSTGSVGDVAGRATTRLGH